MTKAEIMNCAAILAAGIITNDSSRTVYTAESAVELMNQVAALIPCEEEYEGCDDPAEWVT